LDELLAGDENAIDQNQKELICSDKKSNKRFKCDNDNQSEVIPFEKEMIKSSSIVE